MRFGFGTVPAGPPQDTAALVAHAERLGFDVAWMPDQTFYRDPYITLAACVQHTSTITLGLGVTNPYTRHPAMTARAAATLAELCHGRFILGIGAGNRKELIDLLGLPSDRAGARCREMTLTMKRLLAGEKVSFSSPTLTMRDVVLEMTTPPPTPVYLAARGAQILRAAGEVADGVIIGALVSQAGLGFALGHVREGAQRAGRRLKDGFEVVSWVTTVVTDRKSEILERIRPAVAHVVGGAPPEVLEAIGFSASRIAEFKRVYGEGGPSGAARLVDPTLADMLTIVGDASEVAERFNALAAFGVHQVAVLMPGGSRGSHAFPEFDHRGNLERLAQDVFPRVAGGKTSGSTMRRS